MAQEMNKAMVSWSSIINEDDTLSSKGSTFGLVCARKSLNVWPFVQLKRLNGNLMGKIAEPTVTFINR